MHVYVFLITYEVLSRRECTWISFIGQAIR